MNQLIDVLKSPSVWTGKDGVTAVTDLLKNPPLQDKIQFGLMKSSFDTLVKTGEIVTPGTDLKKPAGQLYDAAANAGKNLISASAGLVAAPNALSSLASDNLSNLSGSLGGALDSIKGAAGAATGALGSATGAISGALGSATGAISGALGSATGALGSITGGLPNVSSLANRGSAELGGLLANASKFGVGSAVAWAKGATSATDAISGAAGSLAGGVSGAIAGISGTANKLTSGVKTQMDSLAKQGQFAVNFSDFKLPAAVAGIIPAAGFKGTIDRSTLNAATSKLIGSDKIPLPNFSPQLVDTSALTDAANKAKGLLNGGLDATGLLSKATGSLNGITGSVNSALNNVSGSVNSALSSVTGAGALSSIGSGIGSKINALGNPNAPPYTGSDPIVRARLGLPPVEA